MESIYLDFTFLKYSFKAELNLMNSFKLFGLKRKLVILWLFEGFFKLYSIATERKKRQ